MLYKDQAGLKFGEIQLPLPPLFVLISKGLGRIAVVTLEIGKLLKEVK